MNELPANRWATFKKLVIFQVKLMFDAARDLFLSPISFGCALFDIIKNNSDEQSYFKKLMVFGGKTDVWLNLFAQHDAVASNQAINSELVNKDQITATNDQQNADQLFDKIEDLIREQHAKGGLTASAKNTLDSVLQKLNTNQTDKNAGGTKDNDNHL
jgi:hypothetical protein